MAKWRQAVELAMTNEEIEGLGAIARSRGEAARRVERAQMLLAYCEEPSLERRDAEFEQIASVPFGEGFHTGDRQKAPKIAPLFNAFQRAGPRPENSFLYLLV